MERAGNRVYERIARFPFWEEYEELIKSDVADIKNIGAREAGAITAGKFLSHFTNHPFIHLDIAGVAYSRKENGYRGHGASGSGVRLLLEFISEMAKNDMKDWKKNGSPHFCYEKLEILSKANQKNLILYTKSFL